MARGIQMSAGSAYYLEAVMVDYPGVYEKLSLMVKLPGHEDIWKPVTHEYLEKL